MGDLHRLQIPRFPRTPELRFRILLAGAAEAREENYRRALTTRGLKRSSTFRNDTHSEPRFRALLTEGEANRLALVKFQ
jgi:hypothetical protein